MQSDEQKDPAQCPGGHLMTGGHHGRGLAEEDHRDKPGQNKTGDKGAVSQKLKRADARASRINDLGFRHLQALGHRFLNLCFLGRHVCFGPLQNLQTGRCRSDLFGRGRLPRSPGGAEQAESLARAGLRRGSLGVARSRKQSQPAAGLRCSSRLRTGFRRRFNDRTRTQQLEFSGRTIRCGRGVGFL